MKPRFVILENKHNKFEVYYIERKGLIFKKDVLIPFVTYAGSNEVYPFINIQIALEELKQEVIKQTERQ